MINYIFIAIYFVLAAIWLLLLLKGSKTYKEMIEPLDKETYALKALFPVGFQILELIKYSYDTVLDKKRKEQAKIVFGEQFGEYYYRVNVAEKVTYVSFFVVVSFLLGPVTGNPIISVFGLLGCSCASSKCGSNLCHCPS